MVDEEATKEIYGCFHTTQNNSTLNSNLEKWQANSIDLCLKLCFVGNMRKMWSEVEAIDAL